jgi:GNAT superfamily N-acetyltransferase
MIRVERLFGSVTPELDCGAPAQNEFIRETAVFSQNEGLSATYLAKDVSDSVIGYVTLAMASVRFEAHERPTGAAVSALPALLIAQLAVGKTAQGKGVGKQLVRFATGIAQSLRHSIGCRYLVVDCIPEMVPFYEPMAFRESKGEKRRRREQLGKSGRSELETVVRLAKDVSTDLWFEVDVAPAHLYATELHLAAGEGDIELLNSLLRAGVPSDIRSGRGDDGLGVGATALHVAAARAQVGAIRSLLASGADIDAADGDGERPLHWAVRHNQELSVAALLVAGADANAEGGNAVMSPLAYTIHPNVDRERIASLLRQAGGKCTCEGEPYNPTFGEVERD